MPETKRPLKVFLCHAHNDATRVRDLYTRLKRVGVDVWLDKEKLLPGADWEFEIRKAVRESDVVVVCLSKQFNQAGFRQKEVRLALDTAMEQPEGEIFIIPARLEECDTLESLRKWQWVDLFEGDGYQNLIRALRVRAKKINATLRVRRSAKTTTSSPKGKDTEIITEPLANPDVNTATYVRKSPGNDNNEHDDNERLTQRNVEKESQRQVIQKELKDEVSSRVGGNVPVHLEGRKPPRRINVQIFIAIIGAAGTILAALIGLIPQLLKAQSTPTATTPLSSATIPTTGTGTAAALMSCEYSVHQGETLTKIFYQIGAESGNAIVSCKVGTANCNPIALNLGIVQPGWVLVFSNINSDRCTTNGGIALTPTPTWTATFPYISTSTSYPVEITDAKGVIMELVPAGNFTMGTFASQALAECKKYDNGCQLNWFTDEEPPHAVYLNAYYIDKYEVTNGSYAICVKDGLCELPKMTNLRGSNIIYYGNSVYNNYPVIFVSWFMALGYCQWRGGSLPTEAQWEKAARSEDGRTYPWGEGNGGLNLGYLNEVGKYSIDKSPYGVYDMAGNVWEWVMDWYDPNYYSTLSVGEVDPLGPVKGDNRVIRGADSLYGDYYNDLRTTNRSFLSPHTGDNRYVGFRCARSAP